MLRIMVLRLPPISCLADEVRAACAEQTSQLVRQTALHVPLTRQCFEDVLTLLQFSRAEGCTASLVRKMLHHVGAPYLDGALLRRIFEVAEVGGCTGDVGHFAALLRTDFALRLDGAQVGALMQVAGERRDVAALRRLYEQYARSRVTAGFAYVRQIMLHAAYALKSPDLALFLGQQRLNPLWQRFADHEAVMERLANLSNHLLLGMLDELRRSCSEEQRDDLIFEFSEDFFSD